MNRPLNLAVDDPPELLAPQKLPAPVSKK